MAEGSMEHTGREEVPNFAEQVFTIDLLREMILDKVIRENEEISLSSGRTLRLVQRSWLETITRLLEKHKKPFFNLVLNSGNSRNANVGTAGKLLDRFTNAVMSSTLSTGPSVPAFTVKIRENAFVAENHESFSKMLVHCGTGLVELKLIPHGKRLTLMFPNFTLPRLRKLTINSSAFARSVNVSHFINSLLNAAPSLKEFVVEHYVHQNFERGILDFQYFTLPPSITTLELGCTLTSTNLKMLLKNELPLLNTLKFLIPDEMSYPDGELFRILDKFRATLTKLTLVNCEVCQDNEFEVVSKLRFPVMEKLEEFSNLSINCDLEDDKCSLEGFLPKLSKLVLTNQTKDMFRKWTEDSHFTFVEDLKLHLTNQPFDDDDQGYWASVDLERMMWVRGAFPNVRKLDITVNVAITDGLKSSHKLRRGFTERKSGIFWKPQFTADESPSIRDLQDLTSFSIEGYPRTRSTDPLISDLTFHFALLEMPKLQDLTLGVLFRASKEMEVKWRDQGRNLVISH